MIQYRNFSNASFGVFSVISVGDPAALQAEFDSIYQQQAGAPILHRKSSNGETPSEYIILKDGVYRLSDHWNNVGNSFWLLNCTESTQVCYKKRCIAYCAFENMEHTFIVFNKILSGEYENLRLEEIIHNASIQREKQSRSKKSTSSDQPNTTGTTAVTLS
jgi:hypothetical protein